MEKYCTKCGSVFKENNVKYCSKCGTELSEREGRQYIPKGLKHAVFKRDGYRCQECFKGEEDGVTLEIDHIIPVSKGGTNQIDNLQTLCKDCNRNKHTNEWIAGETDLEIAENEYKLLLDKKYKYEQELAVTTEEDAIIDYKYNIAKIDEALQEVKDKIEILRLEKTNLLLEQKEKEIKNKLYKKLYVSINDFQLELLHEHYGDIDYSRDAIISFLVNKFSENEISQILTNLENNKKLFNKLYYTLSETQFELLYNHYNNLKHSQNKNINFNGGKVCSKKDIINYLVDNFSEDQIYQKITVLENKEKLFNKLSCNLTDSQLELLYDYFKNINPTRNDIIDYLINNYSEKEINQLLKHLNEVKIRKEELNDNLTDNQLKALSNKYNKITDYSRKMIIDDLFKNYSLSEVNEKINRVKKEELEKEKLFKKLFIELTDEELNLFINYFSSYCNYSRTELIRELCNKYSEKEIYQILNRLQKKETEKNELKKQKEDFEKNKCLKRVQEIITYENFEFLCVKFNYVGSRDEFAEYIITNFSVDQVYQILIESEKELFMIKLGSDEEALELLSNKVYRGSLSKKEYLNYVCDNYSENEIYQKIDQAKLEKERREEVLKELYDLTDEQLQILYLKYPKFNNSKEKLINYLYNAYSPKQVNSLLDEIQEQLDNKMDEDLLKQSLNTERMELLALLDSSYKDENYQKMVDDLLWNYNQNQICDILKELDNINNQINELEKQENRNDFCILGFEDVWYYYHLANNGEVERFYAFSKEGLENKVLFNNLPNDKFNWNFVSADYQVRKLINKICSKITVNVSTHHENVYQLTYKNLKPEFLKKEVMLHLDLPSNQELSENLFKIIIPRSSLNEETIICPSCGQIIRKRAVRCKYCKTMMKDLLKMISSELELYGLNPEDFEIV